jgi:hypothetical protein
LISYNINSAATIIGAQEAPVTGNGAFFLLRKTGNCAKQAITLLGYQVQ